MDSTLTVAEQEKLLRLAREARLARRPSGLAAIEPADRSAPLALSFAQQRLWFLERMGGLGATYHIPMRMRLRGEMDGVALRRALDAIIARHEALRTTFEERDGAPVQRVAPVAECRFALAEHDLTRHPDADGELGRLLAEEAGAPFDLERGPLFRGRLVRLAEDDHALLLTLHHIVSDGWSMGVLRRELTSLYDAFRRGEGNPLPPLPIQYADYAAWQRRWVDGEVLQTQADYWRTTLGGAPALLELPTDRPRPAVQDFAGAKLGLELDAELTAGLKALSRRHGATLFHVLLAAWAVVLGRLAGQEDVVVGTPSAGRGREETEGLIGFFVNTLALRVDLAGAPTVAELLGRVRAHALEAQGCQDIPFEQVVELVQPARSRSHPPLFQVMLAWQNAPREALSLPGLALGPLGPVGSGGVSAVTAKFDLSLTLSERRGRIVGSVEYATALFDRETVERLVGYLRRVLEEMVADDTRPVARLAMLPEAERRQVVEEWNVAASYPADTCIHEQFEAQAERTPGATAVVFGAARLTYAELNARANQLAHHLRGLGVGPDTRVAICVERSLEMLVAVLAVLKAGGAYVPLDPSYPADRLEYTLRDSAPLALLTQGSLVDLFAGTGVPVVCLDADAARWATRPETNPERGELRPHHLAYVIYTSGSTGLPKGVMVEHRQVVRLFGATDAWFGFGAGDVWTLFHSFAFDFSVWEIWGALLYGGRLVVVGKDTARSPEDFYRLLCREQVTVLNQTPSAFRQLMAAQAGIRDEHSLRYVIFGGEALEVTTLKPWFDRNGEAGTQLVNMYGITETTVHVTYRPVTRADLERAGASPIGSRIPDLRTYILDALGQPVPVGVTGELYVGGAGVARGYLNRPELTAERFLRDPFSADADPDARLYRTGDLGRWLADGTIEYLGRNDFQVKIRGFRIELGEIEAALCAHADVREAVVIAREDLPGDRRLVAYFVGDVAVAESLRAHLLLTLPEHMVPAAFVRLDALPLTGNGKLDRRALPAPEGDAFATRGYEAPVDETEIALAEIWSELLRVERVGRQDHFFELGGHSLLAVQVVSRVRSVLSAEVALGEVFACPVLADFARVVAAASRAELPPIEPADRTKPLALSFAQQRLWFLERMGGLGATYHIPMRMRLRGEMDGVALRRALDAIVARHEALRTTFEEVEGAPVQRIASAEECRFALAEHDLTSHPDAAGELRRLLAEEAGTPFDLARGPLFRGRLIRLAEDDHVLALTLHHIVSDGWSMGVLRRELGALYDAFRRGEEDPLPPLSVQYADYAAWQRRWVDGEVLQTQAEFWTRSLAGAPELLELPTDRPRPAVQDFAGAALGLELDAELTAGLTALGRRHGATLFQTLLAAWAVVLGRLAGQEDVVVGTPSANRGRQDVEGLIGFFVNTLALRVDLSSAPTVTQLLEQVRTRALEAQGCQDIPFEQVVELVQPARSRSHQPLFQVMFTWQNAPREEPALSGLALGALGAGGASDPTAKFDLSLSVSERRGRIVGSVEYATALFDRETVERLVGYLRRVLEEMVADDTRPVARLAMLPEAERRQVVEEWNVAASYPADTCIHEQFQAQAERTPGATAVVFGAATLTYAELNARANRLAHHLRGLGVGPDTRVAICVERSLEMLVAVLAVLKAGGAYVPLDPSYPADRLEYTLRDSAPLALLTQAALVERFGGAAVPVLCLDAHAAQWEAQPTTDLPRGGVRPHHLAYVIYTSGSTGLPKGVMVEHRQVVRLFSATESWFGFGAGDVWTLFHSFAFDFSVWEIWGALLFGGRLVVVGKDTARSPEDFYRLLCREQVTVLNQTPSAFRQLMAAQAGIRAEHSLRYVIFGGEALEVTTLKPWFDRNAEARTQLVNMYGITETTVHVTYRPVTRADLERAGASPIGSRIPDLRTYILDALGQPVPVGVTGELYVGGAGVARGYLNRPELTAERFVADPFVGGDARMYRTGDLGRWLADGTIEYLGRNDFQVKIRGFRIELGEIEAALCAHADVREAVVIAREDLPGDRRLVAYFVGDVANAESLRAHLLLTLPEHMVPAAFVRLDALPLTGNGKLDRRALPAPEGDAFAAREYEAPVDETEEALSAIWSELLRVERVGRQDHFFELGGHSLLAVQVVSRVRRVLGAEVALGEVFACPVLADFARVVAAASRAELPPIEPADRSQPLALSFAQQRLWFLERMGGLGATYHIPMRMRLRGEMDGVALRRALDAIIARHEALRTTFAEVEGEPVQRIASAEECRFALAEHDLTRHPDADGELRRLLADEAGTPFDLARGPLFRGRLVRLAEDDHALLLTLHHIVSDGWSMGVLRRELGVLYDAFRRGEGNPLPPLPIQYADYAAWQRRWVDGEVLQTQAEFWTRSLAGAPELLELPTDRPRPAVQDFAGAALGLELDAELTAGVKALGQKHGTTPFQTLLAAWAVVLGRLAGQEDVVVGTPSANRGRQDVEGLIGFFVNTLALRVDLSSAPTVTQLLEQVRTRALEAQGCQDIPFEQVVELVQPVRSRSHPPLFQVMFTWQNAPREELSLPGLALGPLGPVGSGGASAVAAKFDLSLSVSERRGRIVGGVEYATALFDRETVERLVGYLRRVLEEMVADDTRPVARLAMLPEAERRQVVEEWNVAASYPADTCIHERFEAQAERTPGATAVVFGAARLTYAELNARANQLAHHLRGLGVGPDTRVAICVERSLEMVVAVLAVLKAGGAYVPLDPSYPADRLEYALRDSAPLALLTQAALVERFGGADVPVLCLDADAAQWATRLETNPERGELRPDHLAYIIYTSGSTGMPKGVMIEHYNVVRLFSATDAWFGFGAGDVWTLFHSFAFDFSVWEIWGALLYGGRLVVVPRETARSPEDFYRLLCREGVTVLNQTPSAFRQLIAAQQDAGGEHRLRTVVFGGEALELHTLRPWFAREENAGTRLVNMYGITETTVHVTYRPILPEDAERAGASPIGVRIPDLRTYVLDPAGEPVPVGVTGELYVGGAGVARGYLNRPELTQERFVADPFAGGDARMYRSGDLGRWLADGTIEYLGRNDFQVKIRGFRIELGEIEARLAEHPQVREVVVTAREDAPGEKRLVAYYVGEAVEAESLRAHLLLTLPEHMVPAAFVRLAALPLTGNGKLDRRALPAPEGDAFATRGYEAPVDETEIALAEIWLELLRVERVGRQDHFFELGGHSLLAVQVVSRVRRVLGAEVALGEVFACPVLADFARVVAAASRAELPPIEPADRSAPLALSFAQQRLWFLERMGGLGATYHIPLRMRLRGEMDGVALRRALDAIIARHEALRTTFGEREGEPVQRIASAEECRFALAEHDMDGSPDSADELRRIFAAEAGTPFNLERGPLFRGRLVRLAEDDHVLAMTLHHIVSDGWSMGVLWRELGALYDAFRRGEEDPLPPLSVQYADYAAWQRRWVDGEVLRQQADYWRITLGGAPALLELPTDRPRPAVQDFAGAALGLELSAELTAGVKALGQKHGTTPFQTLLAAWAVVLGRLSGQDDVVVGTPSAGRGREETEGLIGFFVNTLALRVDLAGAPTVAELLERVKERAISAQQHQDIPFEQVVERVQPARSRSHSPLFQVMFTWQNAPREALSLPGLALGPLGPVGSGGASAVAAKFDLSLTLSERRGRIVGGVEYATALFDRKTVERLVGYLRRVLEEMVADDTRPLARLTMLPEAERRQVVEGWNATDAEFPADACVHEIFEQQVERTPDAVAMVHGDEELTYAQLNARANRVAHHLRERGVGAGEYVAILVPRSMELVVAELAVLKAGAAYVPIDPTFPAERIAFMVADCGARFVLDRRGAVVLDLPGTERVDINVVMEAEGDGANPALPQPGAAAAYVMYTSGSTGTPKGVVVPHRAITRLVINNGYADFSVDDRVALAANPAFDASTLEVWAPLLNGGRIVVIGPEVLLEPRRFAAALAQHEVDVLWMSAGLFNQYAEELKAEIPRLRYLIVGGDALDPRIIARVLRESAPQHLLNGYGPTETTTFAITHEITHVAEGARSIPLGRPISNTRIYILDAQGEPVPVGVTGEIHIGGAGVALGYLNRPELTAERFVADPFSGEAGARMYRTGDLGRWLPDGTIEYLGRNDFQVKIRGFRIEPGEIEARLAKHEAVRETVVLAREDAPGEKRLVAYYVGEALEAEALRTHLLLTLPEHMVPAAFVRLNALPLTGNGKLDRRALPAPEGDAFATRGYEAPLDETEIALAEIWSELLRVERVGRQDHFFELGGHSLLAVQVVSRVRRVLGAEVALGEVFVRPLLADFARAVAAASRAELPPIEPADRTKPLALSFAQQRLWFLERMGGLGATYHIPVRMRLRGELDGVALRRALDAIVARHEALRTTFEEVEGEPVQRIASAEECRFALAEHDLDGSPDSADDLRRIFAEEAGAPFDLERGPLFRGRLVRLAEDDHALLLTMHHIVSDGWSMGVLRRELGALYDAFRRGEGNPLPPLPIQYADYAAWQRRWVDGEVLQTQAEFWTRSLAGAPELLELPTDRRRPAVQDFAGAALGLELSAELTAGVNALGRKHGTTPFQTLLAAWAVVLGRLSGQDDVVVGTPSAGRGREETEGLIGFFVNTLALRVDLAGAPTVAELLERVKERALSAQGCQDIPFEQVVERVRPARSRSHHPLFQVMFAWENAPPEGPALPGLAPGASAATSAAAGPLPVTAKFDLSLTLSERRGRIVGGVEYATALFDRETVERLVGYLRRVLEAMTADESLTVDRLSLLGDGERRLLLENRIDEVEIAL